MVLEFPLTSVSMIDTKYTTLSHFGHQPPRGS